MEDKFYDTPASNPPVASHFTPSKGQNHHCDSEGPVQLSRVTALLSPTTTHPFTHSLLLLQNTRQAPISVSLQSLFPLPGKLFLKMPIHMSCSPHLQILKQMSPSH